MFAAAGPTWATQTLPGSAAWRTWHLVLCTFRLKGCHHSLFSQPAIERTTASSEVGLDYQEPSLIILDHCTVYPAVVCCIKLPNSRSSTSSWAAAGGTLVVSWQAAGSTRVVSSPASHQGGPGFGSWTRWRAFLCLLSSCLLQFLPPVSGPPQNVIWIFTCG